MSAHEKMFSGNILFVVAPGEDGELGIFPNHTPLITRIKPGELRYKNSENIEEVMVVAGGILEIQPKLVKKNITGSGSASKDQVNLMIKKILNIAPKSEDSSDALAVAMSIQSKSFGKLDNGEYSSKLDQAIANALEKEKINMRK